MPLFRAAGEALADRRATRRRTTADSLQLCCTLRHGGKAGMGARLCAPLGCWPVASCNRLERHVVRRIVHESRESSLASFAHSGNVSPGFPLCENDTCVLPPFPRPAGLHFPWHPACSLLHARSSTVRGAVWIPLPTPSARRDGLSESQSENRIMSKRKPTGRSPPVRDTGNWNGKRRWNES